jgi:Putative MetA-pathway of phenol degradation
VKVSLWILLAMCLATPAVAQDPERALRPESAALVGIGRVRTDFAIEFYQNARYSLSGLQGDLLRLGVIAVRVGAGEHAEFQISGVGRDFLSMTGRSQAVIPTTFAGDTTSDFGDLILSTKLKLMAERQLRPALGFQFAVQLPNASNESGLGADETGFYSRILLSKRLGKAEMQGNLGLAILGSPIKANSQADLLTFGIAASVPVNKQLDLVGQIYGRQGPERIGNENLARVQAGARFRAGGLQWYLAGVAGLRHFDPRSGLIVGVTYEFQAFQRKRGPVTIRSAVPSGNRNHDE